MEKSRCLRGARKFIGAKHKSEAHMRLIDSWYNEFLLHAFINDISINLILRYIPALEKGRQLACGCDLIITLNHRLKPSTILFVFFFEIYG